MVKDVTEVDDDFKWFYMFVEVPRITLLWKGRELDNIREFRSNN
jgi:hypothetical protein